MPRPVNSPYTITTEFGVPDSNALYGRHSGVDYAVETGREIYAPVAGKVVYAQLHPVRGNMVVIFDGRLYHRLMHNSRFAVSAGQQVQEGQVVAYAGATGLATGSHCHWDINTNGVDTTSFSNFINPADWLNTPQTTQGGDMVTDRAQLDRMYLAVLRRPRGAGEGEDVYLNKESGWVFDDLYKSGERATTLKNADNHVNGLNTRIADLEARLAAKPETVVQGATPKQLAAERAVDAIKEVFAL